MSRRPSRPLVARALAQAAVVAMVAGVAGCGSPWGLARASVGSPTGRLPACPIGALAHAKQRVKVTFWFAETGPPVQAIEQLVARYNASQNRVTVVAANQGSGPEILQKYQSAIGANQLPAMAELYDLPSAVDSGTLLPAEACMRQSGFDLGQIAPAVRSTYTLDGKYWPAYLGILQPLMYYNAADFDRARLDPANPPRTLDQLEADARALKAAGVRAPVAFGNSTDADLPASLAVIDWLTSAGQTVVNAGNGRTGTPSASTYDTPDTQRIYTTLDRMRKEGLLVSETGINNLLAMAQQSSAITFDVSGAATGIAGFLAGSPTLARAVRSAPLPGLSGPATAGMESPGFYIMNRSKPEVEAAAWDFCRWLLQQPQGVTWLSVAAYLPFQTPVADSPGVRDYLASSGLAGALLAPAVRLTEDADRAKPVPLLPSAVTMPIDSSMQALLSGIASPAGAVSQANRGINTAVQQYYH